MGLRPADLLICRVLSQIRYLWAEITIIEIGLSFCGTLNLADFSFWENLFRFFVRDILDAFALVLVEGGALVAQ